ncbi:MAG: restriction endonuclease [Candidatus Thiodiazotropha lotti]|nr:restriction endonuclease [Candidatus Thiodiazotropha lotti]
MSKPGSLLEKFVEEIELLLVPQGVKVTPNKKIFNSDGIQIAEFDITLEGKIGSSKFTWIIECRDRPSQGPAPGSWIEQLAGRRNRFKFDKVIAVSTTGFSTSATEYAKESGIEIRIISEKNITHISDWFLANKIGLHIKRYKLESARLLFDEYNREEIRTAIQRILDNPPSDKRVLLIPNTREHVSLSTAFTIAAARYCETKGISTQNIDTKKLKFQADYKNDNDHYVVETIYGQILIRGIQFTGEVSVIHEDIPLTEILKYHNISNDEEISTTINFNLDVDENPIEISFHKIADNSVMHVSAKIPRDIHRK